MTCCLLRLTTCNATQCQQGECEMMGDAQTEDMPEVSSLGKGHCRCTLVSTWAELFISAIQAEHKQKVPNMFGIYPCCLLMHVHWHFSTTHSCTVTAQGCRHSRFQHGCQTATTQKEKRAAKRRSENCRGWSSNCRDPIRSRAHEHQNAY